MTEEKDQRKIVEPPPKDSQIFVLEDNTKMKMSFSISRPENGGAEITLERLQEELRMRKVTFGIREEVLNKIAETRPYGQNLVVAQGEPSVDGVDGRCEELFSRTVVPSFKERPDGTVDFKEMNLIVGVAKDQQICNITLPTPGTEGRNIYDAVLKPHTGRPAIIPQGENTRITEDGLALVAALEGSLVCRKNKFCIDNIFTVDGDVDNAVGNITFSGNVVVKGNVQEGYKINSKGNVTVKGSVEGADIVAEGSIILEKGINGMNHGTLTATNDITSPYIENCKISAGGNVTAESIINCSVESDGNVEVRGKRGLIAGGRCTVFGSLKANMIGSRAAVQTVITLGVTPKIMREKADLEQQFRQMREVNEEAAKNLAYLERLEKTEQLTLDRKAALNRMRIQGPIAAMKLDKLSKQIEEMEEKIRSVKECVLTCKRIYPPAKIWIGNSSIMIQETVDNARIYRGSDGELSIGKF